MNNENYLDVIKARCDFGIAHGWDLQTFRDSLDRISPPKSADGVWKKTDD